MTWTALVGAAGAWIGTFACIPPTWRVVRRQSARDYSWWGAAGSMLAMTCTLIYLGSLGNWLAVTAQAACYVAYLVIVVVKWRTERARKASESAGELRPVADDSAAVTA